MHLPNIVELGRSFESSWRQIGIRKEENVPVVVCNQIQLTLSARLVPNLKSFSLLLTLNERILNVLIIILSF